MKYFLVLLLLATVQSPSDEYDSDGHLKSEHQIPPNHYCMNTRVYNENMERLKARNVKGLEGAHPCDCTYACHVDENGNVTETGGEKGTSCKSYCSKDGRKCTCHTEEPCDLGHNIALKDMNNNIVAMSRH